jgi:predicted ATPase/DNA-binding winged helix-turn-helix (wHTH) protein
MANWRATEDYGRAVLAIMLILARNDAIKLEYQGTRRRRRHRPFLADLLRSSDVGMPTQGANALMNDRTPGSQNIVSFGPFSLSANERLLRKNDQSIPLGGRALDVLIALTERAGEVVTNKELIARVWQDLNVEEANLRVHISTIRKALGDGQGGARYISSVAGRGYCFVAPTRHSSEGGASPPTATDDGGLKKLPRRLSRMVGREDAVMKLAAQLMRRRFVSIVGPGGIGKTTVAVAVAHELFTGFEGAVVFVDLGVLTNSKLVSAAVASTLGFMARASDPLGSIIAFLGDKKLLLILDSCEHVIDAVATLAERVVDEAPQTHVLTTSREALRVRGEHVHLLYSLEGPPEDDSLTAAEALAYPAAELFMERAVASGHSPDLTDADARTIARICRKLDGIALAIELVASRVGPLGIRGTAELLDSRFGLLWQGRRTALPRHETLNAMLDWSYNLLSDQEKVVLSRLSVFVGDFSLPAACFVASGDEDDAQSAGVMLDLVEKSLVSARAIGSATYYRLLDITRAYASSKLVRRGEMDTIARRHAMFFSRFLQNAIIPDPRFGDSDLSAFSLHVGNARAALEWALSEHGDVAIAIPLAASATPLFMGLSLSGECRRWSERAVAILDDANRGTRREMILQEALAVSVMDTGTGGDNGLIRSAFERALTVAEALGDQPHQLQLLAGLNLFSNRLGDLRNSRAAAERGAAIALALSDPAGAMWAEWMLGISHSFEGNQAEAQLRFEQGFSLAADHVGIRPNYFGYDHHVRALLAFSRTLWLRGFSDRAVDAAQKAIDEAVLRDHPVSLCIALIYTSSLFLWIGDLPRARGLIERLISCAGRYSLESFRAAGFAMNGKLAIASDDTGTGIPLLQDALKTIEESFCLLVPSVTGALAEGLWKAKQLEKALFTVDGAITHGKSHGVKLDLPDLLRIKSLVSLARNERKTAVDCLNEAIEIARSQSALAWELRSAIVLARLHAEAGKRDLARRDIAAVYDRFTEGFQTADLKLARSLRENLQA